jgi:hypothetical protein
VIENQSRVAEEMLLRKDPMTEQQVSDMWYDAQHP